MFIVTYAYEMSDNNVDRYLDVQKRTKNLYLKHGCLGYEIFKEADSDSWLEINRFRDSMHYESVEKSVEKDPEIETLWKQFCSIVEKEKIVIRKFERML